MVHVVIGLVEYIEDKVSCMVGLHGLVSFHDLYVHLGLNRPNNKVSV